MCDFDVILNQKYSTKATEHDVFFSNRKIVEKKY